MKKTLFRDLLASLPTEIVSHIQRLERTRQDFVANVSHELRTPLTVIHGYLEALLDQHKLDPTLKKIYSQMHQQTLRMEHLIDDLLLLSRLEFSESKMQMSSVNVSELLDQIVHEAIAISGEKKHIITVKADTTLVANGNREEFFSLFSNLIFNAVKYTPARGKITIRWYKEKNHAYFSVKDTGIGIAEEHIPRLTERFYRVDPARSRESGGTGLGLAIAKHILNRLHGKLDIKSKIGKGSEFTCSFPITS